MTRITTKHLDAQIGIVNGMLGNADDAPYPTPGVVVRYSAYGGHGVHRVVNDAGGQSDLMGGCQTARECQRFLAGMITALRIARDAAAGGAP